MSDVIPVMVRHPVLLDWASREAMEGTVGPGSHHSFRGFRLHMTWMQPPTGGLTHHIALPRVLGEDNMSLVEYELEKFTQALMQGLKIAIVLKPPTQDHWNIALDPILPWILVDSRSQCKTQQVAQAEEEGSKEAGTSQPEVPTHGEPPGIPIGGGGKSLPMKTGVSLREYTRNPRMYSCPPPPDDARDGECVGGGPDSGSNSHGGVCKTATDCG